MRWSATMVSVVVAITVSSCTHRGGTREAPSQLSVITRADMERVHAKSALDAVQRLRSDALTARAPSSVLLNKHLHPVVFLNEQYLGAVDELRNMPADGIEEIRIISGTDAATKFGSQYGGGIIQVIART
jgi:outer membrane cobalamin receptor